MIFGAWYYTGGKIIHKRIKKIYQLVISCELFFFLFSFHRNAPVFPHQKCKVCMDFICVHQMDVIRDANDRR